eukprot:2787096-Rhodomonas_salina.1
MATLKEHRQKLVELGIVRPLVALIYCYKTAPRAAAAAKSVCQRREEVRLRLRCCDELWSFRVV